MFSQEKIKFFTCLSFDKSWQFRLQLTEFLSVQSQKLIWTKNTIFPNQLFQKNSEPPGLRPSGKYPVREANGKKTAKRFEYEYHTRAQNFLFMKNLNGSNIGLHPQQHNNVAFGSTHGFVPYTQSKMQVKRANCEFSASSQFIFISEKPTYLSMTSKMNNSILEQPSKRSPTSVGTFETGQQKQLFLLSVLSMSTTIEKNLTVRVTNTTEPYSCMKNSCCAN